MRKISFLLLLFPVLFFPSPCTAQFVFELNSIADLDGTVSSTGYTQISQSIATGDTEMDIENRGFLSFDISAELPDDVEIQWASLKIFQVITVGNGQYYGDPYETLGTVLIDHLEYGDELDGADFDLAPISGSFAQVSEDVTIGWKTIDVTTAIRDDIAESRQYSQFRIHFTTSNDGDSLEDQVFFESENNSFNTGNRPILTISLLRLVTLASSFGIDGFVRSDGYVTNSLGLAIGDTFANHYQRGFLHFDLSGIPEHVTLTSVYLRVFQHETLGNGSYYGNPYDSLGSIFIEKVDIGDSLDSSDFDSEPLVVQTIPLVDNDTEREWKYADVTSWVRQAYNSNADSIQFRLRFQTDTDSDSAGDLSYIESSDNYWQTGNSPELNINYQPFVSVPALFGWSMVLIITLVSLILFTSTKCS